MKGIPDLLPVLKTIENNTIWQDIVPPYRTPFSKIDLFPLVLKVMGRLDPGFSVFIAPSIALAHFLN